MHDFVGRLIDDSYEKLFLDDMPIEISDGGGCKSYSELLEQCNKQLTDSNKEKVLVIKVGEMFDVIVINEITKKLQENFVDKKFILLVDDYRKLDLDFPLIESMAGWATVIQHAKEHDGEEMDSFKQINNHQRNKLFLSRNNKGKEHRIEWVKFLEDNDFKEKGFVSEGWNGFFLEHLNDDFIETVEWIEDDHPCRQGTHLHLLLNVYIVLLIILQSLKVLSFRHTRSTCVRCLIINCLCLWFLIQQTINRLEKETL